MPSACSTFVTDNLAALKIGSFGMNLTVDESRYLILMGLTAVERNTTGTLRNLCDCFRYLKQSNPFTFGILISKNITSGIKRFKISYASEQLWAKIKSMEGSIEWMTSLKKTKSSSSSSTAKIFIAREGSVLLKNKKETPQSAPPNLKQTIRFSIFLLHFVIS
jgi:hypothetical protein